MSPSRREIHGRFRRRVVSFSLALAVAGLGSYSIERPHPAGLPTHGGGGFAAAANAAETETPLDVNRVRQLMEKSKAGETLSPEDQAYLKQAKQRMQERAGKGKAGGPAGGAGPAGAAGAMVDTSGLTPLTDLAGTYKGEDGGLYGGGRNTPPEAHLAACLRESEKIQPLDADGQPAKDGKIGLITNGFSNTSMESADFKRTADADPQKSPQVVIVNGAIGARAAVMWAYDGGDVLPPAEQERLDKQMDLLRMPKADRKGSQGKPARDTWPTLEQRIQEAGLTAKQVQVAWMKHVEAGPRPLGEFPAHAKALQADMTDILLIARKRFPNLRVVYFSSRTYGGWAGANAGSPEPYAHESAFAVRWLIQSQIQGNPTLNCDPARGEVKSPLVLWGPYIWARGDTPRKDGFVWGLSDVAADRLHPSEIGCKKVTEMLLNVFHTDPCARRWYLKRE